MTISNKIKNSSGFSHFLKIFPCQSLRQIFQEKTFYNKKWKINFLMSSINMKWGERERYFFNRMNTLLCTFVCVRKLCVDGECALSV